MNKIDRARACVGLYKTRYTIAKHPRLISRATRDQLKFSVSQTLCDLKTALSAIFQDSLEIFINFTYNISRANKINIRRYDSQTNGIAPNKKYMYWRSDRALASS